jgi:hypothetical protein
MQFLDQFVERTAERCGEGFDHVTLRRIMVLGVVFATLVVAMSF